MVGIVYRNGSIFIIVIVFTDLLVVLVRWKNIFLFAIKLLSEMMLKRIMMIMKSGYKGKTTEKNF
jgi:hypothetical protein